MESRESVSLNCNLALIPIVQALSMTIHHEAKGVPEQIDLYSSDTSDPACQRFDAWQKGLAYLLEHAIERLEIAPMSMYVWVQEWGSPSKKPVIVHDLCRPGLVGVLAVLNGYTNAVPNVPDMKGHLVCWQLYGCGLMPGFASPECTLGCLCDDSSEGCPGSRTPALCGVDHQRFGWVICMGGLFTCALLPL